MEELFISRCRCLCSTGLSSLFTGNEWMKRRNKQRTRRSGGQMCDTVMNRRHGNVSRMSDLFEVEVCDFCSSSGSVKNNNCFLTRFLDTPRHLPLANQTDSPAPKLKALVGSMCTTYMILCNIMLYNIHFSIVVF